MRQIRIFAAIALAITVWLLQQAQAADPRECLSKEQRRAVIASKQVVPLAVALRAVRGPRGEMVKARLCPGPKGLVYQLTLLARDGKITRATVDAATGKLAETH
jgi:uncharacterized membrane protein YkoI